MSARDVTDRGLEAWRAKDAEGFAECYSDDATITMPGGELHCRDGARAFFATWHDGMPDNTVDITHEYEAGSVVIQEGIFRGTHTGTLMTPDGQSIPATGRSVEAAYCDVFEIDGDRITSERLYFDQVTLLTQLGLMPAPAAAAAS